MVASSLAARPGRAVLANDRFGLTETTLPKVVRLTSSARLQRLWGLWSSQRSARTARLLVTGSFAVLFLHAAATFELVYTVGLSQILLLAAIVVGAPFVLAGWRRLPLWLRGLVLGLLATYVLSVIFADTVVLPSQGRGSGYRGLVYLADLAVGLTAVCLISGLWPRGKGIGVLVWALAGGAAVAGLYGIYQWLAQRLGLPLADVNNAVNSDGVTHGTFSQGPGLFGGERVKGTFTEPHFFADFLASMLPLVVGLIFADRRWRRNMVGAAVLVALALILTVSAPAWMALAWSAVAGLAALALSRRLVGLAATAAAALVIGCGLGAAAVADPGSLSSLTGRPGQELNVTTRFRLDTWDRVIALWSTRPVLGFGAGQGSVRLAERVGPLGGGGTSRPLVLGTANGLWAAALLDGGVPAFSFWLLVLGGFLLLSAREAIRRPTPLALTLLVATTTAVLLSQMSGDRLDLEVWALLGLVAATCGAPRADGRDRGSQAEYRSA
jgi:O-antigen ligase